MKEFLFDLQLFGDGGGAGASGASGADGNGTAGEASNVGVASPQSNDNLESVVYGVSTEKEVAQPSEDKTVTSPEEKSKTFDNMIKKGGEYADEFQQRTQKIINERFKEMKNLESTLDSHKTIMDMLSEKYGVDATDSKALQKALEDDESFYEQAAFERGLSVKDYKELRTLERENEQLKAAEQKAQEEQHTQEIYADWTRQGEEFANKYGLQDFDMRDEVMNDDFLRLISNGISVESAYIATHPERMIGGAMAATAQNVEQRLAQNIASRHSRPAENGISSSTSTTFKSDVNQLTNADMDEVLRRVANGATISFG